MAVYPYQPFPASISVANVMDPTYSFQADTGHLVRRARYPRPLRSFQLDYLGLTTYEMRIVRQFVIAHRLSVTPFEYNPYRSYDTATVGNTTPILLTIADEILAMRNHEWVTGQWVLIWNSTVPNLDGGYRIIVPNPNQILLEGTTARGTGVCEVRVYLPRAIGSFADETMPAATKLIGPESTLNDRGRFSFQVTVQEIF